MVEWSGKGLVREKPLKRINDILSFNASSNPGSLKLYHLSSNKSLNMGRGGYAGLPSALATFLYLFFNISSMGFQSIILFILSRKVKKKMDFLKEKIFILNNL